MLKYLVLLIFISCSSPKTQTKGGEFSVDNFSYCGGILEGYFTKIYGPTTKSAKAPAVALWLYFIPSTQDVILNYVIGTKSSLSVNFETRNLYYQIQGHEQRQHAMILKLTVAANSVYNAYPDYKITLHNRELNQWKVYKKGFMGQMFLTDYKIVTLPLDQQKNVNSNMVHEIFNSQFHEGIYLGEGVRINLGALDRAKLVVKTPAISLNGVSLPAQILNFNIDFNKIESPASNRCPTITEIFRWN